MHEGITHVKLEGDGEHSDDDVGQGEVRDEKVGDRVHPSRPAISKVSFKVSCISVRHYLL